ncbi:F420-dependent oxidoreductase-like protein [Pseudonocardia hierapolitana]|uniref:F420-dependent oxidoreductase-like protein n=1 Tax=Pseudonocardia hierapolitana TaxID=1128676 RepID=A0A561T098_9PSEU|nr:F420-dependent oxidoreductase-like protein [Pseudonocardia hierapolitana]
MLDVTIGLSLSPTASENAVDHYVEVAAMAADAGVGAIWISQFFDVDALSLAALIARAVPDIAVGTAVVPIYPRHPLVVAAQALTAQAAGRGRFQLGLGLGSPPLLEHVYGTRVVRPIRYAREYLTALRSVFETGEVDLHGEMLTAVTPMPVVVPGATTPPPILLASVGTQSLRLAGELADGTFPYLASPATLAGSIVPTISAAAAAAGRPAPRIVMVVPAVVTSDVDGVRERAAAHMAFYDDVPAAQESVRREGLAHAHELAVIGDEETVAAAIERYFAAGATEVSIAYTDIGTPEEQARTIGLLGGLNRSRAMAIPA